MRFTLIAFAALAFGLVAAQEASSNTSSTKEVTQNPSELPEEAIEVIHSGGDPFGDDDYVEPVRRSKKHHHKSGRSSSSKYHSSSADKGSKLVHNAVQVTWYASHDLKNPACGGGSNDWQPTNNNHIGAVMKGWTAGGAVDCGKFVQLCNEKTSPHKCVKVRVVDQCAGCKENHVDLTKSAFKRLATGGLNEGVVHGLKMYENGKPSPWDFDLFGPLNLS